jgi:outer membrane protein TolC
MLRFFYILTLLIAASSAQIAGADAPPPPLTRSEAIQLALQHNLELEAARYSIRRAEAASVDAGALPNPEISISGASDFAFNNEGEYAWSVGLSQQFPITGRLRSLRSLAVQEIQLAEAEIRVAELELAAAVVLFAMRWRPFHLRCSSLMNSELSTRHSKHSCKQKCNALRPRYSMCGKFIL